jgi:hypothetical protein
MNLRSHRVFLVSGLLLVVVANVAVFLGVRFNRQPPAVSALLLTERELAPTGSWSLSQEDSGLSLRFDVRSLPPESENYDEGWANERGFVWGSAPWLTLEKLRSLGFPLSSGEPTDDDRRRVEKLLPKDVFVVLELNGNSYQRALRDAQDRAVRDEQRAQADPNDKNLAVSARISRESADAEQNQNSRLFCIDADLDPVALSKAYSDRPHYAIVRGTVQPAISQKSGHWRIVGQFFGLRIPEVNVPLTYRPVFGASRRHSYTEAVARGIGGQMASSKEAPRYSVMVAWGRRFEPWIVAASPQAQ